jgi:uncharacterized NAD-dependent epimerase/dehydratase family protein
MELSGTALVLTAGHFRALNGKTAHGLVRGPSRFTIVGLLDRELAGRDAGEVLDGRRRGIPCFADLDAALAALPAAPQWLIVGVAFHGGRMPEAVRAQVLTAVQRGIGAVNGLHDLLADDPRIAAAAAASGARLYDIRRPKRFAELRFWSGEALALAVPRVAVLGTDCALGKRTTANLLIAALAERGLAAEMIWTGQTGWLQGHRYGFALDATPNDFVSGELERSVLDCAREAKPDLILLEGQSALRNPAGPCGSELILSAGARGVVLVHAPGRRLFEGLEESGAALPGVESEIELVRAYGARVLGLALNDEGMAAAQLEAEAERLAVRLGMPVSRPLADGCRPLVPALEEFARERLAAPGGAR